MARLDPLLRQLAKHDQGMLILEPGSKPLLRVDGNMQEISKAILQSELISVLLQEAGPATASGRFRYELDGDEFDFEVNLENGSCSARVMRAAAVANAAPAVPDTLEVVEVPEAPPEPAAAESPVAPIEPPMSAAPAAIPMAPATPLPPPAAAATAAPEPAVPEPAAPEPVAPEPRVPEPATPVEPSADGAGPLPAVTDLLEQLIAREGSDLHLSSKQKPRMRIHGDLLELEQYLAPESDELKERLWKITPERNRGEFEERHDTDFAVEIPGRARFRVNLFEDRAGIGAVFRQIPYEIPSFEELGLPDSLRSLARLSKGLVLVTGPTGSGKSTTLAAIIDLVNQSRRDHIITIEDPIEFVHPSKSSLIHQREPGVHTVSFSQALRAALREDPDVILVGEMRDLETVAMAIETAETGHLVFGTLHTTTAPSTVERIVDQFPGDRQEQIRMMLADSLRAVVSQTLLKKIEGGRVAALEILVCTPAVSNLIREGKTFQIASAMQTGRKVGMITQTEALYELVKNKVVAPEEAHLKAVDKEALVKKLQADGISIETG